MRSCRSMSTGLNQSFDSDGAVLFGTFFWSVVFNLLFPRHFACVPTLCVERLCASWTPHMRVEIRRDTVHRRTWGEKRGGGSSHLNGNNTSIDKKAAKQKHQHRKTITTTTTAREKNSRKHKQRKKHHQGQKHQHKNTNTATTATRKDASQMPAGPKPLVFAVLIAFDKNLRKEKHCCRDKTRGGKTTTKTYSAKIIITTSQPNTANTRIVLPLPSLAPCVTQAPKWNHKKNPKQKSTLPIRPSISSVLERSQSLILGLLFFTQSAVPGLHVGGCRCPGLGDLKSRSQVLKFSSLNFRSLRKL